MKLKIASTLVSFCLVLAISAFAFAEDMAADNKPAAPEMPNMEEMMKKMTELAAPGEHHKHLEQFVGEWNAKVECEAMGPDMPKQTTAGKASAKMILGGRYLQEEFQGEMMGQPFHGISLTGYSNAEQHYQGVWLDEMSTMMMNSTGQCSEDGKTLTLESKCHDPMTNTEKSFKMVNKVVSNDEHVFTFYELGEDGKEKQMMQITYTRAK